MDSQEFGNYRIIDALGTGGMGLVYKAEHKLLGQPAAIKVLRKKYSHKERVVQRFFNEAKAAAAVEHPGIVAVYDFGFAPDGRAYLVMELLSGETLRERLHRLGTLPIEHALRFAAQIANVLEAAHAHGIVHRDLKPDNIFLTPDPHVEGGERVKILDFGLAKIMQEESDPRLTHTKVLMGTPLYMSPEQCKNASKVDARADLYSLGCILFEMLAGDPPLRGATSIDTISAHIYQQPPPLSECWPHAIPGLDALVAKLLAKDPEERYACAADVELALTSFDPAVVNRPYSDPEASKAAEHGPDETWDWTASEGQEAQARVLADGPQASLPPGESGQAAIAQPGQAAIAQPGQAGNKRANRVRRSTLLMFLGLGGLALGIVIAAVSMRPVAPANPALPALPASPAQPPVFYGSADNVASDNLVTWQVTSEPPGAEVYYRGQPKGTAPIWVQVPRDPKRTEKLLLRLDDHADAIIELSAASDADKVVALTPHLKIALYTKPPGAEIFRGDTGELLGVTPGEMGLPPGNAPIAFILRLSGYRDERVEIVPDRAKTETVALTKIVRHAIVSAPTGAEVFRDGVRLGVTPYDAEVNASRSSLTYKVAMEGYETETVRLRGDEDAVTTVALRRLNPQPTTER